MALRRINAVAAKPRIIPIIVVRAFPPAKWLDRDATVAIQTQRSAIAFDQKTHRKSTADRLPGFVQSICIPQTTCAPCKPNDHQRGVLAGDHGVKASQVGSHLRDLAAQEAKQIDEMHARFVDQEMRGIRRK